MRTLPTFDTLAIVFENCDLLSIPYEDVRYLTVECPRNTTASLRITYRSRYRRILAHNDITQLHLELDGCVVEWYTVMYDEMENEDNALQQTEFMRPDCVSVKIQAERETCE